MPPIATVQNKVLQDAPHCHAPIHPPGPTPTPVAHPPVPLAILPAQGNVLIGGQPAVCVSDQTASCALPSCVPGGPGIIAQGSPNVLIGGLPAARVGDPTVHPSCVAPIPGATGKIIPAGSPTVISG